MEQSTVAVEGAPASPSAVESGSPPATALPSAPAEAEAPAEPGFEDFASEFALATGTGTAAKPVFDPLRAYNRAMFQFNDKFFFWVAKPLTRGYGYLVPEPGRVAVRRAFHNLKFPIRFVNSLLQLKFKKAASEIGCFVVNSTAGVGGLFDPAGRWLKWHTGNEDFGQTFAYYGVGQGFPVVLPLLGQTNLRDGLAMAPNFLVSPIYYIEGFTTNFALAAGEQFNFVSLYGGEYESVKKEALDPYTFIRDATMQQREKDIRE